VESTWMLKSPLMMRSEGEQLRSSKSVENSDRKVAIDEDGGR
jgi:hypothetical protein